MADRIEELKKEVEELCIKTDTRLSGIEHLINVYFIQSQGWSEEKAYQHVVTLFYNGTIDQLKAVNKDDKQI